MAERCEYLEELGIGKVTDKQLEACLEEIIKNQKDRGGLIAIRGKCALCKKNKMFGSFGVSKESLTMSNDND